MTGMQFLDCLNSITEYISSIETASVLGILKDWMIPIFVPICSVFVSALLASKYFYHQERVRLDKNRVDIANKWLIISQNVLSDLIEFKRRYHGRINSDPLHRAASTASPGLLKKEIPGEFYELAFFSGKKGDGSCKWANIALIGELFRAYMELQQIWIERDAVDRKLRVKIVDSLGGVASAPFTLGYLQMVLDRNEVAEWIWGTELAIARTEVLLHEFRDLVLSIPLMAKQRIDGSHLNGLGWLLEVGGDVVDISAPYFDAAPDLDFAAAAVILSAEEKYVRERFAFSFGVATSSAQ